MEEYKRRLELFSLYDHTNIEKHLEKMASKGWMIDSIGSTFWRYKKTEPKKLRFSVVYYPKEVREGTVISADRQNFIDLCSSGGWNYVINSGKMHAFATDDDTAPPIDTDAAIQIECIHKYAKTEIVYGYFFLALVCLALSAYGIYSLWKAPVDTLTDIEFRFWCTPLFFIFSVINIVTYLLWYKKAKTAAENGEFTDTKKILSFEVLFWFPMYVGFSFLGILSFMRIRNILLVLGLIALAVLLFIIFKKIKSNIFNSERREISKLRLKRFAAAMLVFVWAGAGIGAYIAIPKPYYKVKVKSEFSNNVITEKVYTDNDTPIDFNYFEETKGKTVSLEKNFKDFLLIKQTDWQVYTVEDGEGLYIDYNITDVRFTPLLERCKNEIIFNHIVYEGKPFNLNTADFDCYRYYIDSKTPTDKFVFCQGNRIAVFEFDWEPTEEEIYYAAERLLSAENSYVF